MLLSEVVRQLLPTGMYPDADRRLICLCALADVLGLDLGQDIRPHILAAAAAMAGIAVAVAQWYASSRQADRRTLVNAVYGLVARAGELLHQPIPSRAQGNSSSPPPGEHLLLRQRRG
jgi:hypothetical protein